MKKIKQSIGHAWHGIKVVYTRERNFKIHCMVACAVILLGFVLGFTPLQWILIILCIGLVLSLEVTNSVIEYTWNHLEPNHHPVVGIIKDAMAGAVLIASFAAAVAGICIIFFLS
jgi:diacylglycerol kinase